jgi:hypothetical protein
MLCLESVVSAWGLTIFLCERLVEKSLAAVAVGAQVLDRIGENRSAREAAGQVKDAVVVYSREAERRVEVQTWGRMVGLYREGSIQQTKVGSTFVHK